MMMEQRLFKRGDFVGLVDPSSNGPREVPIPKRWFMLRVHPNCEFKVMRGFKLRNISGWVPTITGVQEITRYRRGYERIERRNVTSPLITGAVIIPDFEADIGRCFDVPGTIGLYRIGPCIPMLTPQLLNDLRNIEAIGKAPRSKRDRLFEIGKLVRVVNGPFRDFCARVERFDGNGRLSIGVEIFGRITPIEVSEGDIEAV